MNQLVLSLFPGIGLLDRAFEEEGFTVVRGPDLLWGGEVKRFHPPAGRFEGVIGGPPCQAHVRFAALNRAIGNHVAEDLNPEFCRVVGESAPLWWLMEQSPLAKTAEVCGYVTRCVVLDAPAFGCAQNRVRRFHFGTRTGAHLRVEIPLFLEKEPTQKVCLASEGRSGRLRCQQRDGRQKTIYAPARAFTEFCRLQGLPEDFLSEAPFTKAEKYRVVGNGVPLPMGRAVARAVRAATEKGVGK